MEGIERVEQVLAYLAMDEASLAIVQADRDECQHGADARDLAHEHTAGSNCLIEPTLAQQMQQHDERKPTQSVINAYEQRYRKQCHYDTRGFDTRISVDGTNAQKAEQQRKQHIKPSPMPQIAMHEVVRDDRDEGEDKQIECIRSETSCVRITLDQQEGKIGNARRPTTDDNTKNTVMGKPPI